MCLWLTLLVSRVLSVYYNVKIGLWLVYNLFGGGPNVLTVKSRPDKPSELTDTDGILDQFVEVNGVKLHYVEKGDRDKPLMLFIHGFPEFWYSWRHQLREFSQDHWCVALDQRGYNESDKPEGLEPYKLVNLVEDIRALVEHLAGGNKCVLVCHDWGSIIGFEYVMRHMDTVDRYIMMGAPPIKVHRQLGQTSMEQFQMSWYIYFFQGRFIPELALRAFDLQKFNDMKSQYTSKADIEVYKYVFGQKDALTPPINYYRANAGAPYVEPPAPASYAKGLFLLAENDLYISKDCGPLAEKVIPELKFVLLEDTDHFCQQSNPLTVNQVMRKFLQDEL